MKILEEKFKVRKETISETDTEMNTIAIQHAMSIILQKRRVENNEPVSVHKNSTQNEITIQKYKKIIKK